MTAEQVTVIGGGIIGVCSALWLQQSGASVTLVEQNAIGMGASYGNAGCFNPSSVVPVSMPGVLWKVPGYLADPMGPLVIKPSYLPQIMPWLLRFVAAGTRARVARQAEALSHLLRASVQSYQPLVQGTPAADLMRHQGHLFVYRSEKDYAGDALGWQLRRDNGVECDVLRGPALFDREPALTRNAAVGIYLPQNGHTVNPFAFVTALADKFSAGGGTILKAQVNGFDLSDGRLRAVLTDQGALPSTRAVIACGAHSRKLALALGDRIPLDTERGYHIVIQNPEAVPRVPITDASGKFVASPMDMGLRIAGTVEFAGLDAPPNYARAVQLIAHGKRLLPALCAEYPDNRLTKWMGFRPSMPDSLPVIGASQGSPDVIYAFGHGHVGLAGGARTGMLVRDLVLGLPASLPAAAFSPARFRSGKPPIPYPKAHPRQQG